MPEWTPDAATVIAAVSGIAATLMGARFAWLRRAVLRSVAAGLVARARKTDSEVDDAIAETFQREITKGDPDGRRK